MAFDKWKARLTGEKVPTFLLPDAWDEGYYRRPLVERQPNGSWKILDYVAVSYFMDGNQLIGLMHDGRPDPAEMTERELHDETLWSYVVTNPIPYEWYLAVAERGEEWPDKEKWTSVVPAIEQPAEATADAEKPAEPPKPRHQVLLDAIEAEGKKLLKTVTCADDEAVITGSKNKIAELRLAARREGEAEVKPLYNVYVAKRDIWSKPVKVAEELEAGIVTTVKLFRQSERIKEAAAAAERERIQREEFEANEREADRAIARGEPAPEPVIAEAPPAAVPAPAPVVPVYGKKTVKAEVKKFAVIEDWAKVFAHFQDDPEIRARLEKLATETIRAGGTVPGATYREGFM